MSYVWRASSRRKSQQLPSPRRRLLRPRFDLPGKWRIRFKVPLDFQNSHLCLHHSLFRLLLPHLLDEVCGDAAGEIGGIGSDQLLQIIHELTSVVADHGREVADAAGHFHCEREGEV
jgi:hypothetical protein